MNENKRSVLPTDISAVDASHCHGYLIDLVRRLKGDNRNKYHFRMSNSANR